MTIAERMKELREQKGLSQVQFAEQIGVTKQAVSKFEKGLMSPSAVLLGVIADALECSADYLLGRE